jgi:copper chaperone NosL
MTTNAARPTDGAKRGLSAGTARWLPFAVAASGGLAFYSAFALPWWKFLLYAPQYPRGLRLEIGLTGLAGDVHEVSMLNHYIGMKHLEDAAAFERHHAGLGVAGVVLMAVASLFLYSKRFGWLAAIPGALLPLGFIADSSYWLYRFGHELDVRAPVHVPGFTPQLFGNGKIGQFMTFAEPARGFWIACLGALLFAVAGLLRWRSARRAPRRGAAEVCVAGPQRGRPIESEPPFGPA